MTVSKFLWQHLMEKETWWSCMNSETQPCCSIWVAIPLTASKKNDFCQSEFHISSQVSFLDFIMPLCNHSFHSAMPQEACPSGFLYLGIQVTWACWYWNGEEKKKQEQKKRKGKLIRARNATGKLCFLIENSKDVTFSEQGANKASSALQSHWAAFVYIPEKFFFSTLVKFNTII